MTTGNFGYNPKFCQPAFCLVCKHLTSFKMMTCKAFPEEIPLEVWKGIERHDEPIEGDNGFQYELRDRDVDGDVPM